MDLRIVIALLCGAALGACAMYVRVRAGLSAKEWYFLTEFYESLRAGAYDVNPEEEGTGDGDE